MSLSVAVRVPVGIVEEERMLAEALTLVVERSGNYTVLFCCAPGELLARLEQKPMPQLILFGMAHAADTSALEPLRAAHPHLRVIVHCRVVDDGLVLRAYRSGAGAVLLPDVSMGVLERVLDAVMQVGVYHDEHTQRILLDNPDGLSADERRREKMRAQIRAAWLPVLQRICRVDDPTYKMISSETHIPLRTVEKYVGELCALFGVHSKTALVMAAVRLGIVEL